MAVDMGINLGKIDKNWEEHLFNYKKIAKYSRKNYIIASKVHKLWELQHKEYGSSYHNIGNRSPHHVQNPATWYTQNHA